ncbi:MAG TPA: hypothetical protein VMT03_04450 [Polyangia bacterium]|nr:hypothetical protein [Polyangia bacterium]
MGDDLVALGYLLVQPFAGFTWADGLLPDPIVSACSCLCPQLGDPSHSIEAARTARRDRFPAQPDVRLIGLALAGHAFEAVSDLLAWADRRLPVEPGGELLGFEPLNIELGQLSHSWLCNRLHTHYADTLGIRPNPAGFIATVAEAQRCCDDINTGAVGAEPGPWFPFALISYAADAT